MAEQFFEKIDGLVMEGLRRDLAAAEARVLTADADAAEDVEFLCLSIKRRLRDRDAIRREAIGNMCSCGPKRGIFGAHDGARARRHGGAPRSTLN
jgi:hypothetical protein